MSSSRSRSRSASPINNNASMSEDADRLVYLGNLAHDIKRSEINTLFEPYGNVTSIDLKNGFAFVKLDGGHHEAFAKLNDSIFNERKIRVEFAKGAERTARQQSKRKHQEPSRILFVANFGPRMTERGLEALFAKHGKVVRSSIDERKRSFGFVEFDRLDDAVSAQKEMDNSPFEERVLTVEFSEGPIRRRSPPRRRHDDSPRRRRSSPRRHHHDDRDYRRSRSRSRDRRRDDYGRGRDRDYDRYARY